MLLFKRNKATKPTNTKQVMHLSGFNAPIHLYIEKRRGSRISLLKENINVRLPNYLSKEEQQKELKKLLAWASERLSKKDIYNKKHVEKDYWTDRQIKVLDDVWTLEYHSVNNSSKIKGKVVPQDLKIIFTGNFEEHSIANINKNTRDLLIKIFKDQYKEKTIYLVSRINDKTLNKKYNTVILKYLNSRWGSCSVKGNINISLRLLLAPMEVVEYVILHELCHLQEMNHSARFWQLVASYMPNYKNQERWLKENGHLCDF
ncbi:MAG: M48 family metallopeptidase [Chitinophagales bacterium]